MIRSMTAYARINDDALFGTITWELRTVNNRYLDQALRLPEEMRALDPAIRERVSRRLKRGKLDCSLKIQYAQTGTDGLPLNLELATQIAEASQQLSALLPNATGVNPLELLRWPGVIETKAIDPDAANAAVLASLDSAMQELVATREREGERLEALIRERCEQIEQIVGEVRVQLPQVIEDTRTRIHKRLAEVSEDLDPARLEQEMVIFAQKVDVAEELDRLDAHIQEVKSVLKRREPTGRRLDFLMQELNREANTLGSKSVDTTITRASVDLKVLIEQMREQVQNIE